MVRLAIASSIANLQNVTTITKKTDAPACQGLNMERTMKLY